MNKKVKTEIINSWIGVVGSKISFERINSERNTWWCMPSETKKNDILFMYCSSKISRLTQGIFALYEITSISNENSEDCNKYGSFLENKLFKVEIKLIKKFHNPLKISEMKKDFLISRSQFIKKNLQVTCFKIPIEVGERISFLTANN